MGAGRGHGWIAGAMGLLLGLLLGGCPRPSTFSCQSDDQCLDGAEVGQCTALGYCAFEDEACESGWAFGDLADDGLAGECVPPDVGTGTSTGGATQASAEGSSVADDATIGSVDGTGPVEDCSVGPGIACIPEDPCAVAGLCDDAGACVATQMMQCNDPPNDQCYLSFGECQGGRCNYVEQSEDFPCDDGNPCTVSSFCDGQGECSPGDECPIGNQECVVGSMCTPEGCSYEYAADGAACGELEAERCCDGVCVDTSTDDDHCGGCNTECDGGQDCEPLTLCGAADGTTGRCSCQADSDCPRDQICDGFLGTWCEPVTDDDCDGSMVRAGFCGTYCGYP